MIRIHFTPDEKTHYTILCIALTIEYILSHKWKLYTFIIQIANTIVNQCSSLCLYKIGHITKAIICFKFKVTYHA